MFPPLPPWEGMHPLIVHLPIGILFVAPVLLLMAIFWRNQRFPLTVAAFVLVALGAGAAFLAAASGEAGEDAAEAVPAASAALERHEELADTTKLVFAGLAVLLAVIAFGPRLLRRAVPPGVQTIALVAFLLLYAGGMLLLAKTGHEGGQLVHQYGVRAPTAAGPPDTGGSAPLRHNDED